MIAVVYPTIMDGIVVRWYSDVPATSAVSASRRGVTVDEFIETQEEYTEMLYMLTLAFQCHRMLARGRVDCDDVRAWLREKEQRVVDVRLGETLGEAMAREEQP